MRDPLGVIAGCWRSGSFVSVTSEGVVGWWQVWCYLIYDKNLVNISTHIFTLLWGFFLKGGGHIYDISFGSIYQISIEMSQQRKVWKIEDDMKSTGTQFLSEL
jgi:hypothetical protein